MDQVRFVEDNLSKTWSGLVSFKFVYLGNATWSILQYFASIILLSTLILTTPLSYLQSILR